MEEYWEVGYENCKRIFSIENCRSSEEETFSQKKKQTPEWRDCIGDLLQILNCECDLFNYRAIKLVTYTVCMCLNRSCTQCVCEKYIDWQLQLTFDNLCRFSIYRLSCSTVFMSTIMCSSACRRYEPLIVAVTFSHILLFLVITCMAYIRW